MFNITPSFWEWWKVIKKSKNIIKKAYKKKPSEIVDFLYEENPVENKKENIKDDVLSILHYFDLWGPYGISFFDKNFINSIEKNPVLSNILTWKKWLFFKKKIESLIKMNINLLRKGELKIDLFKEKDLDLVYDFLKNPIYKFNTNEYNNIIQGIVLNINNNINSPYMWEIIKNIISHRFFNSTILNNILNNRIAGQNLNYTYFKGMFLANLNIKAKEFTNINSQSNLLIIEDFLASSLFWDDYKKELIKVYQNKKEDLEFLLERLEKNKRGDLKWIISYIKISLELKREFSEAQKRFIVSEENEVIK